MKKLLLIFCTAIFLCGCRAEPAWETVDDTVLVEAVPVAKQLYLQLPEDASAPTFQDDGAGELYLCNGYSLTKQIKESGDLKKTVLAISGQDMDRLQILKTLCDGADRYDFVWTAATEEGLQLGRACILDDGSYHYTVSVMAEETAAGENRDSWEEIFSSCRLLDPEINLRTGS